VNDELRSSVRSCGGVQHGDLLTCCLVHLFLTDAFA
jgi:hypothetical protein